MCKRELQVAVLEPPKEKAVKATELAWAAGIFEGEGTVTIAVRNSDETYRVLCIVGNTDRSIICFFQKHWPGWVQPAYGKRPGRKPSWSWTVATRSADTFMKDILPYIRTVRVRRKIVLAQRFRIHRMKYGVLDRGRYKVAQRRFYGVMRKLNRRGVPK